MMEKRVNGTRDESLEESPVTRHAVKRVPTARHAASLAGDRTG
jgi:hypothetical protein